MDFGLEVLIICWGYVWIPWLMNGLAGDDIGGILTNWVDFFGERRLLDYSIATAFWLVARRVNELILFKINRSVSLCALSLFFLQIVDPVLWILLFINETLLIDCISLARYRSWLRLRNRFRRRSLNLEPIIWLQVDQETIKTFLLRRAYEGWHLWLNGVNALDINLRELILFTDLVMFNVMDISLRALSLNLLQNVDPVLWILLFIDEALTLLIRALIFLRILYDLLVILHLELALDEFDLLCETLGRPCLHFFKQLGRYLVCQILLIP